MLVRLITRQGAVLSIRSMALPAFSLAAGTPLGDPIEVGALAAVLLRAGLPRAAPLHLTAAKSFMGHAEPAAGVVGTAKLALVLGHQAADPLLHLASVNPYVASAGGFGKGVGLDPCWRGVGERLGVLAVPAA